jgi:hypothetical protein
MKLFRYLGIVLLLALPAFAASPYRVASFQCEVTVPLGHALMGGGIDPAKEIVDPLFAQGIVLLGPDAPIVWLSIDWCEIRNDAYDAWRDALAEAAGTSRERILLAAIHQHDTPVADFAAQTLLDEVGLDKSLCDVPFVKDCIARTASALRDSLPKAKAVTHYGVGTATVENVASNRRVVRDGKVLGYIRNSSCKDEDLRAAPAGLHDPKLSTLSFWDGDTPVVAMSTYAVHPMSYYGRGGVSADFIGMARSRMQATMPDAPYLYFSGCSGDLVAGKWNDGSEAERPRLAERLHAGMQKAWDATQRYPLGDVSFRTVPMVLPIRDTEAFSKPEQQAVLADAKATTFNRNLAAMGLSWRKRHAVGQAIDVCAVEFGKAVFLLMPAESFVHYQLHAQELRTDVTVLTSGYGESAPGYIPDPQGIEEGFIEKHIWCWVDADAPDAMHEALRAVLVPSR